METNTIKHGYSKVFIPLAEPKRKTYVKPKIKHLICNRNHKILKSYGIFKGQQVTLHSSSPYVARFYDEIDKINRVVVLSTKLLKRFKEVV